MDMAELFREFTREGIDPLPASLICIAQAIIDKKIITAEGGDTLSHGFFMALKELSNQGVSVPLSFSEAIEVNCDVMTEGHPGLSVSLDNFDGNGPTSPIWIEHVEPVEVKVVE